MRESTDLDDPVHKLLPASVKVPKKEYRQIKLLDLATHTSGLPRMPTNFDAKNPNDPYYEYTNEKLYKFLSLYKLPRSPGERFEYSNLGYGLLGHALSTYKNKSFETLVIEQIGKPLDLQNTTIRLSKSQRMRLSPGHDLEENAVAGWNFLVLAGCGALRSTANDMLIYIKANMGLIKTPLSHAMTATHVPRHNSTFPGWKIGMGWFVNSSGDVAWHDGGTGGYYSFTGFDKQRKFGFVWLSNSRLWRIGALRERLVEILLDKEIQPLRLKRTVKVKRAILESYVGQYRVKPGLVLEVSLQEGHLILGKPEGPPTSVLYPESQTQFFFLENESITVSFDMNKQGKVREMVFKEKETKTSAKKSGNTRGRCLKKRFGF
jgi:CubicO group peptidase (beta-lactamase class C family)